MAPLIVAAPAIHPVQHWQSTIAYQTVTLSTEFKVTLTVTARDHLLGRSLAVWQQGEASCAGEPMVLDTGRKLAEMNISCWQYPSEHLHNVHLNIEN